MNDVKLLEQAAYVCGYEGYYDPIYNTFMVDYYGWNPLEDNAAAFMLAVDRGIAIKFHENSPPELHLPRQCAIASDGSGGYWAEEAKPDKYAAMRRAIVRAVANDAFNG